MKIRNHLSLKFEVHISFAQKPNLKQHMASVHAGNKPFKSEVCSTSFTCKSSLKVHIESVHDGKKPFKCEICSTTFTYILQGSIVM